MSDVFSRCSAPGCEHDRHPPAALCSDCLREIYGYGRPTVAETGRLVEPATSISHLPKPPEAPQEKPPTEPPSASALQIAELVARLGSLEQAVSGLASQAINRHTGVPGAPGASGALTPLASAFDIPAGACHAAEIPRSYGRFRYVTPRYLRIRAHVAERPHPVRVGSIEVLGSYQLPEVDRACESSYLMSDAFDLQPGADVDWPNLDLTVFAHLFLRNPWSYPVRVETTLWVEGEERRVY